MHARASWRVAFCILPSGLDSSWFIGQGEGRLTISSSWARRAIVDGVAVVVVFVAVAVVGMEVIDALGVDESSMYMV